MTMTSMKGTAFKLVLAAAVLGAAAALPLPAAAHSDVSVQLSWGYPVVLYRTPHRYYEARDYYPHHHRHVRPVVVYHYVDRPTHSRHVRGHGHRHAHDRYCRH